MRTSPYARLGLGGKIALTAEILFTYIPALRALHRGDLGSMVLAARDVRRPRVAVQHTETRDLAMHLGWIVRKVLGVLPTDARCLVRSLVLTRMLERRSVSTRVVIGVKPGPPFEAHAWVEHAGVPVLPDEGFPRLYEL